MAGKPWSEERKAAAAAAREAKKAGAAPSRSRNTSKRDPTAVAVEQILHTLSVPLIALGRINEGFLADALAVQEGAAPLGDAVAEVAKVNPAVAEWLEKGAPATPYLLLGTVVLSLGAQIAVNHGVNVGPLAANTYPRAVMVGEMRARMQAANERQAQYEAVMAQLAAEEAARQAVEEREQAERQAQFDAEAAQTLSDHVAQDGWDPVLHGDGGNIGDALLAAEQVI